VVTASRQAQIAKELQAVALGWTSCVLRTFTQGHHQENIVHGKLLMIWWYASGRAEVTVPKILIAFSQLNERHGWPTKDLADWLANLRCNANYAGSTPSATTLFPAAGARNTIAHNFKDCGADWILMVDNDMSPPMNLLDAIKDAPADALVVVPKFFFG